MNDINAFCVLTNSHDWHHILTHTKCSTMLLLLASKTRCLLLIHESFSTRDNYHILESLTIWVYPFLPVKEYSRPCRRDSCTGPSTPQPPSERYDAHGLSDSVCRVCGHARCVQSWSRARPPRCPRTAIPVVSYRNTHTNAPRCVSIFTTMPI